VTSDLGELTTDELEDELATLSPHSVPSRFNRFAAA
jgi:hypothetical protein